MRIELRKIKRDLYDLMIKNINENINYYKGLTDKISINDEEFLLEELSDSLKQSSNMFFEMEESDLNIGNLLKWKQNFEIGKLLHRKLNRFSKEFYGVMNEKFFWTYIAHTPIFR